MVAMIEYKFIGRPGQFLMGVPARDLTAADLAEVEAREGIGRGEIEGSELYVVVGSKTGFSGKNLVSEVLEGSSAVGASLREIGGIGAGLEGDLAQEGILTLGDLAGLDGPGVVELAEKLPRVNAARLLDWRNQARRRLNDGRS